MDAHMVRISPAGNLVWIKNLGTNAREHSQTIIELPGGGYLLGGNTSNTNNSHTNRANAFLIKTDNNGNVIFGKEYDESTFFSDINETILLNDGNLLSIGETRTSNSGNHDIRLLKTDTNGILIWSKRYSGPSEDIPVNVREKANGELVISGFTGSFGSGNQLFLMTTDSIGNVIWSKTYGGTGADETEWWGKIMELSSANEIIIVGGTTSFGAGNEDVYIVKTNECGESFCNEQNIVLNGVASSAVPLNFNVLTVSGGSLVNTTTTVNTINFIDSYLCEDTVLISPPCNLTANFSSTSTCYGDTTFFNDLSTNSIGNIINWQWYFGNGDSLVGVQNPSYLYSLAGTYNVKLIVTNDSNCVDSITITLTVNPVYAINLADTICQGDSIFLAGAFQTIAGNYIDSLQSMLGCDSIITTTLNLNPIYTPSQNVSICQGDSIFLGGAFQNSGGNYVDSLQTIFGCDSILTTTLVVNPIFSSTQNSTICQGDSILFNGNFYNTTGLFTDSLQTQFGCDSLLNLNLIVNPTFQTNQNISICLGDSIFLGGAFQTTAGIYVDSLKSNLNCDSILITTLTIGNLINTSFTTNICQGDSIFLGGAFQNTAGTYIDSLLSSNGCDSIVTTNLILIPLPTIFASEDTTIIACGNVELSVMGALSYSWSPISDLNCSTCPSPIATPASTTTYIVTGTTNGCSNQDTVIVYVEGESVLIIPNVFTPNGDGVNDGFNLIGGCVYSIDKQVFNRWGQLLFQSNLINEVWNGRTTAGDEAPEGTYFYIFKVGMFENNSEEIKIFKGTVSLLR